MKILLVSEVNVPTVSGVASSTDSIARFLVSLGHEVFLICPKPLHPVTIAVPDTLHLLYTPSFPDPFFVGKPMTLFPLGTVQIWKVLRSQKINIAHIQEPGNLGINALILCKLFRVPMVGAMHFSLEQFRLLIPSILQPLGNPMLKLFIRLIYPHYDAIMVPTQTAAAALQTIIGKNIRISPISNGVNTEEYIPIKDNASLRKKYHIAGSTTVFTYIGRLDKDKNIETILQALVHTSPHIHFLLAGIGKQELFLRQYTKRIGITDKVSWIGRIQREAMIELYQASDCFIITSPVETQSIVVLQAIACGLPIIAANAGALPELVHDGKNGFLVEPYDSATLATKMEWVAQHPTERKRMSAYSRQLSLAHHKPIALGHLEELYRTVLQLS